MNNNLTNIIFLIFTVACFILLAKVTNNNDTKLNNTWDKCQTRFEKSGAPMEARDGIMRACFAE